ncbi:MAG: hypothetical protein J0G37_07545 [Afipia sp.]|nr:hypothetical protein [Afipia sp.]
METSVMGDRIVYGQRKSIGFVMPGPVPGIHVFLWNGIYQEAKTWMAGTSPAMTKKIR